MSRVIDEYTIPADVATNPEHRARIAQRIVRLETRLTEFDQAVRDRDRIIDRQGREIEQHTDTVRDLKTIIRSLQAEARERADMPTSSAARDDQSAALQAALTGTREVLAGVVAGLDRLLEQYTIPRRADPALAVETPTPTPAPETAETPAPSTVDAASYIPCTIPWCHKPRVARGLCDRHYSRWRTHGNPYLINMGADGRSKATMRDSVMHREIGPDQYERVEEVGDACNTA